MTDGLSTLYRDLLGGSYDCVDRIVLNAYFRMGHSPGGFRVWWRALTGSDETLENAYLMRLAGRFSRRVRGYAKAHNIAVIDCSVGERKHDIATEYRSKTTVVQGLFLVLVGRAPAPVWDVSAKHHIERKKPIPYVNHYSFHILDRESLREIETCLSVQVSKLYSMGFRDPVRRSTLADANEARDWRIYAELAQRLITRARRLYVNEDLGFDLANTVYALDSTTIDLCLAVFPWAHFRTTKAAVKMHTLLDLRGNIPSFIHVSDGKLHDVHALDLLLPEAGAIYVMDRGYVDFARLHVLHQAGAFFVTRAKSKCLRSFRGC